MGLKIVSGTAKGHKLRGPKKAGIRPAAARVRKSLFEILGDLSGKKVLDLFAGTGSMGLESLSKGAAQAVFVDLDSHAVSLLFHNLKKTGFLDRAQILKMSALGAIARLHKKKLRFDVIFLDPPYDKSHIGVCMKKLLEKDILSDGGVLLCEHSPREIPPFLGGLKKVDERKYGQTLVSFFRKSGA
jgi:16S rRNA (guanine(966)-N(2))-methyltransferase RsmD